VLKPTTDYPVHTFYRTGAAAHRADRRGSAAARAGNSRSGITGRGYPRAKTTGETRCFVKALVGCEDESNSPLHNPFGRSRRDARNSPDGERRLAFTALRDAAEEPWSLN